MKRKKGNRKQYTVLIPRVRHAVGNDVIAVQRPRIGGKHPPAAAEFASEEGSWIDLDRVRATPNYSSSAGESFLFYKN